VVSADALQLRHRYYDAPPVICYLDRGVGAAIRRARTRLPGGGDNPVAIIKVPRERMVGSGIASSLIHEGGAPGRALLELVESLRPVLKGLQRGSAGEREAWQLWERWISEIVADFWSIASIGVGSTLGLMGVVSLPRAFVFRLNFDDPHPAPWIRVKLSAAIGQALLSAAALGPSHAAVGGVLSAGRPRSRTAAAVHDAGPDDARPGGAFGEPPARAIARPLTDRRAEFRRTAPGPSAVSAGALASCAPGNVSGTPDRCIRRHRPGTGGGKDQSGRRECGAVEVADSLGSAEHSAGLGELRSDSATLLRLPRGSVKAIIFNFNVH